MRSDIILSLEIAAVYMGAVIGAGFATGQEIYHFFARFGSIGLGGSVLAGLLFALYGSFILVMAVRHRCSNYGEFLNIIMGDRVARLFDIIGFLILFGGNGVMLAGSGAIFQEQLGFNPAHGIFLSLTFAALVVFKGLRGLLVANSVLVPAKFLCAVSVALVAIYLVGYNSATGMAGLDRYAEVFGSSVLYVSYNLVIPLAVLSSLGRVATKKSALWGGMLGGLGLGIAAYLIASAEICFYPAVQEYQLPLLYIASRLNPFYGTVLSFLIWAAILTTLISNTHGMASRLAPYGGGGYRAIGFAALLSTLPFAKFEFAFLVRLLYPLFGYAGLIMLFYLTAGMIHELKEKLLKRNIR